LQIYKMTKRKNSISGWIIYNFIIINILFDISLVWAPRRGLVGMIRAAFILGIYFFYFWNRKLPMNNGNKYLYIYIIYIVCLFPFVTDLYESMRVSFQVIISMLSYVLGYTIIKNYDDLKRLNRSIYYGIMILFLNFIMSTVFGLGNFSYDASSESSLYLGNYSDSINIFAYSLFVIPLLSFDFKKSQKSALYLFGIFLLLIVIISTKRIALITVVSGMVIYAYTIRAYIRKQLITAIVFFIILTAISPLYFDTMSERWNIRIDAGRVETASYKTEARYLETSMVWSEIFSFKSIGKSLFGHEAFYSSYLYGGGIWGRRQLHVDYNQILFTTGIFGLILYLAVYFNIYKDFQKYKKRIKGDSIHKKILFALFYMMFFCSLVTSFAGQMYAITFRSIIFLYLGSLSCYVKNEYLHSTNNKL
jgi:hypothetical protein